MNSIIRQNYNFKAVTMLFIAEIEIKNLSFAPNNIDEQGA